MLGLRDRLRGVLGRERPAAGGLPARAAPVRAPEPAVHGVQPAPSGGSAAAGTRPPLSLVPPASRGPRPVHVPDLGPAVRLVDLREAGPLPEGAQRVAFGALGAWARGPGAGGRVVVIDADEERAAAGAERLAALGVDAAWLAGGAAALVGGGAAGRPGESA